MNSLVPLHAVDTSNYIIKDPQPTRTKDQYISEIWYRDGDRVIKPILQTPRLRVKYGARRYNNTGPYSYCLSMYNRDIDPEIGKFFQMLRDFDQCAIKACNALRKKDNSAETPLLKGVANRYWSALRRKNKFEEYYLQLKLISDLDGGLLTSIHNDSRDKCAPTDVKYGVYTDQFIGPAYLIYNKEGIHPIWHTHQVVISDVEKVFLSHCLLDQVAPRYTPYIPCVITTGGTMPLPPPPPPPPHLLIAAPPPPRISALSQIKVSDIRDAMKKLRKATLPSPLTSPPPSPQVTASAETDILTESIRDFPASTDAWS